MFDEFFFYSNLYTLNLTYSLDKAPATMNRAIETSEVCLIYLTQTSLF